MKISIRTLGCKVNQAESSSIEGLLRDNMFEVVKHTEGPDICIINTCSVTAKSDYQSRQLIRRAVKSGAKVIASGCYAQLKSKELAEIKGLDLVIGNSGKSDIVNYVQKLSDNCNGCTSIDVSEPVSPLSIQPYSSSRTRAFLKIQDGCNFSCSYCTVPRARGKSRSLDIEGVLKSVNNLVDNGYKEIVITGIHIGSYGSDLKQKSSLIDIVNNISGLNHNIRIRLSSIEPQEFKDEFIDLIKEGKVCPHVHIPLQSGSDNILKKMRRGYSTEYFEKVINRIITSYPNISIGTDIIIGFPGESDNDFYKTVKFVEQLPLSYLHVFPFSRRPNTDASGFEEQINEKVKRNRVKRVLKIGNEKKYLYKSKNLGNILNVIIEQKEANSGLYSAMSDNYLRISVESDDLHLGQCLKVRAISLTDKTLIARPVR